MAGMKRLKLRPLNVALAIVALGALAYACFDIGRDIINFLN